MSNPMIHVLSISTDGGSAHALQTILSAASDLSLADEASDESQALQKLKEKHVDVVVIDYPLKDVDGIALTRKIHQSDKSARVLISTHSDCPMDIFTAMDAGADGYVLKENHRGLEMAIRSVKLGTVWLDPGIATKVLDAMVTASSSKVTRTLPTGMLSIPLFPDEKQLLTAVAASNCADGVCMIDPSFLKKLRRFGPSQD